MASIRYAVVVSGDQASTFTVEYLYPHLQEAAGCVRAICAREGAQPAAFLAEFDKPLALARTQDLWAVYVPSAQRVYTYPSREEADAAVVPGATLVTSPVRCAMPAQRGVPQFTAP